MDLNKMKDTLKNKAENAEVNIDSVKGMPTKKKIMLGSGIVGALFLTFSVMGGGNPSVTLDDIKTPFPSGGSIEEQCTASIVVEYEFWRLMIDKNESQADIIAVYTNVAKNFDQSKVSSMSDLEKDYWKTIRPMKYHAEEMYSGKVKEKRGNYENYSKMIDLCVKTHTSS